MATYTETAILKLRDRGTVTGLRRVNRELDRLARTAAKLNRNGNINFRVKLTGLSSARGQLNALAGNRAVTITMRTDKRGSDSPKNWGIQAARGFRNELGDGRRFGRSIGRGFNAAIGGELFQGLQNQFREAGQGVRTSEAALSKLFGLGATGKQISRLQGRTSGLRERYGVFTTDQIMGFQAEAFSAAGGNQDVAELFVDNALRLAAQRMATDPTLSAEQALAGNGALFRAIEASAITGPDGRIDPKQLEDTTMTLQRAALALGEDFNVSKISTAFSKGATAVAGLTQEGLFKAILGIEAGLTGFDLRAFDQEFAIGSKTDSTRAEQERLGLLSAENRRLADEDQAAYVQQVLIPTFEKWQKEMGNGQKTFEDFLNVVSNTSTSQRAALTYANQGAEFTAREANAQGFKVGEAEVQQMVKENMATRVKAAEAGLQGAISASTLAMEDVIVPFTDAVAGGMTALDDAIRTGDPTMLAGAASAFSNVTAGDVANGAMVAAASAVAVKALSSGPMADIRTLKGLTSTDQNTQLLAQIAANTGRMADGNGEGFLGSLLKIPAPVAGAIGTFLATVGTVSYLRDPNVDNSKAEADWQAVTDGEFGIDSETKKVVKDHTKALTLQERIRDEDRVMSQSLSPVDTLRGTAQQYAAARQTFTYTHTEALSGKSNKASVAALQDQIDAYLNDPRTAGNLELIQQMQDALNTLNNGAASDDPEAVAAFREAADALSEIMTGNDLSTNIQQLSDQAGDIAVKIAEGAGNVSREVAEAFATGGASAAGAIAKALANVNVNVNVKQTGGDKPDTGKAGPVGGGGK